MSDLHTFLSRCRRRMHSRRSWLDLQNTLWIPFLVGLVIQIAGRLFPIQGLILWTLIPIPFWAAGIVLSALIKRISLYQTALSVDLELGLKERLSTAYSLHYGDMQAADVAFITSGLDLIRRQYDDAVEWASKIDPILAFPFTIRTKPLAAAAGLLFIVCLSALLPNRMELVIQERRTVQEAAKAQASQLEQAEHQIENLETLSPEARQALVRQLKTLTQSLRENPGDLDQALADLSRFEDQLRLNLDPNLAGRKALGAQLSAQVARLGQKGTGASSSETTDENFEALLEKLDSMSIDELDQTSRALAQLSAMASQVGDPVLASALADLAEAAQESDPQAADQAAQAIQSAMKRLDQQLTNRDIQQSLLSQAATSRQALSQAARPFAQGQSGSQAASTTGSGGQGQQPGGGGGTQARTLPPAVGGRANIRPRGSAPSVQVGAFDEQVYAPWQRSLTEGNELFIPGQDTGEGEISIIEGQGSQPGISNPALAPYSEVYYQYLSAANQAVEQGYIPAGLSEYIRRYFSSLEPR